MHGLDITLLLLVAAVVGVVLFRLWQMPAMLGYLAAGALIGPHALGIGLSGNPQVVQQLAEFGVVFLMFSIGLEFSLARLRVLHCLYCVTEHVSSSTPR